MSNKLQSIWLLPPLAFARVGSSPNPVDNFVWGPNDNSPRGTGKTTIVPVETLDIDNAGVVTARMPDVVVFKDVVNGGEIFRPVCPWFELHGQWTEGRQVNTGPITGELLTACGIDLDRIEWKISVANRKAHNMTLSTADLIRAAVTITGKDTAIKELRGLSEPGPNGEQPLVPSGASLPLGRVQVAKLTTEFPEVRLRFTPPVGTVYGPKSLHQKIRSFSTRFPDITAASEDLWTKSQIPPARLLLNDNAKWSNWVLSNGDARTVPVLQFAHVEGPAGVYNSLGLIDDFSDGFITCTIHDERNGPFVARSRVVVTPPDFAPDRRHVVSLADELKDRADRDVQSVYGSIPLEELSREVQDLFQRIWETMSLVNIDAMNTKSDFRQAGGQPPYPPPVSSRPLPLTTHARRNHRRLVAIEVLEDLFRERDGRVSIGTINEYNPPRSLEDLINAPPNADGTAHAGNAYRKMPALMRGSDGGPMHLTRRQYEMLQLWISRLKTEGETF